MSINTINKLISNNMKFLLLSYILVPFVSAYKGEQIPYIEFRKGFLSGDKGPPSDIYDILDKVSDKIEDLNSHSFDFGRVNARDAAVQDIVDFIGTSNPLYINISASIKSIQTSSSL